MFSEAVPELFLHSLTTKWLAGRQGPRQRGQYGTLSVPGVCSHTRARTHSILFSIPLGMLKIILRLVSCQASMQHLSSGLQELLEFADSEIRVVEVSS